MGLLDLRLQDTYALTVIVEESFELDYVGVSYDPHDLQFTVLLLQS